MKERTRRNLERLHGVDGMQLHSGEGLDDAIRARHGLSREDAYPGMAAAGRRSRDGLDGEELRLVILALISSEPRHGYDLIGSIAEMSGGFYKPSPGSIYPKLQLLVDERLVTILDDGKSRRKTYAIDASGRKELAEKEAQVCALFDRLGALAQDSDSVLERQMDSALEVLVKAVALCRRDGSRSKDKMERVPGLILDAAHRIERL